MPFAPPPTPTAFSRLGIVAWCATLEATSGTSNGAGSPGRCCWTIVLRTFDAALHCPAPRARTTLPTARGVPPTDGRYRGTCRYRHTGSPIRQNRLLLTELRWHGGRRTGLADITQLLVRGFTFKGLSLFAGLPTTPLFAAELQCRAHRTGTRASMCLADTDQRRQDALKHLR